jgi:alpha-galactosidase
MISREQNGLGFGRGALRFRRVAAARSIHLLFVALCRVAGARLAALSLAVMLIATPGFGASQKPETLDKLAGKLSESAARFVFRNGDRLGVLSLSGHLVCDEALIEGRFVTRYWNPCGQVWPEMHFAGLKWEADQPADSFRLSVNTRSLSGGFEWQGAELCPDPSSWRARRDGKGNPLPVVHSVVSLLHKSAGIAVKVHTRLDGGPFMIRWLEISNLNPSAVALTEVAPFAGMLWNHRYEEHLPAGVATPFAVAYNQMFEWGREGDFHFAELPEGCKMVNRGKKGRSGWGRPVFWARNRCNGQTFVCELAWGGNYEWALDCRLRDTDKTSFLAKLRFSSLFFKIGLSGFDEALRVLDAGETVVTPSVHLALFQDNDDAIVQATHDHVRQVVMPEQIPGRHVEIEANHRGYLCDRENVPDILRDIDVAAAVGAEMYVIDAGWYGKEPNQWWRNVGDWHDGKWMEPGGGLKAVTDYAHTKGMKFGLWVEIEAVGANSDLKRDHPEWLLKRDGQPIVEGRALDLTLPEVMRFERETIERLIRELGLDMFRIDHNHTLAPSGNRTYQGYAEDLTWRYYEKLYEMFDGLRARFPNLVFQNCAGGGGRLDWGTLARFHNTELSDWMRLPRGIKILNGVSMSLPPEIQILMRTFGTETGEQVLDGDVDTQLRHCFCRLIFRGVAPSLADLSPYLKRRIANYLDIYKDVIRPTMIEGRVFHHTPFLPLEEATPWCVLEYAKADRSTAVAAVFRTSCEKAGIEPDEYVFRPRGVDPGARYKVQLDSRKLGFEASGELLTREGVRIRLEQPQTSELLILRRIVESGKQP